VQAMFGIDVPIKAEIYKMLVYGEGAMFKPAFRVSGLDPKCYASTVLHMKAGIGTEKMPGMFGTLVIALPSPHSGGDVVVRHRGKKHVFKTSEQPAIVHNVVHRCYT
jgi:hypothetical protein